MSVINTPNMSLTIPLVSTQPGPAYATNVNNSLTILDSHDHTSGNGVAVPTAGLNINADLTINDFALTDAGHIDFTVQGSPLAGASFPGTVYVSGVDLYYNDINGNQIQLTAGGQPNTAAGNISGLSSPAAASYVSGNQTFIWQSNSGNSTPANLDAGSVIIREVATAPNGVTLSSPTSLSADYTLTLPPSNPGTADGLLTVNSSGVMNALDLGSASEVLRVNSGGTALEYALLEPENLDPAAGSAGEFLAINSGGTALEYRDISETDLPTSNFVISGVFGASTSSTVAAFVPGSVTAPITVAAGKRVQVMVTSPAVPPAAGAYVELNRASGVDTNESYIQIIRNPGPVVLYRGQFRETTTATQPNRIPLSIATVDSPSPGNYTYQLEIYTTGFNNIVAVQNGIILAWTF